MARLYGSVRWVAWLIWAAVGFDEVFKLIRGHVSLLGALALSWVAAYLTFAAALWLSGTLAGARTHSRAKSLAALGIAEICIFSMLYLRPDSNADSFVLVLAWQAALVLPAAWAVSWILLQTALLVTVLKYITTEITFGWGLAAVYGAVQTFAFVTATVARREARISEELTNSNAELKATQIMLAQASQAGERIRIARELHDVLGHDLTALGLHLEVALNSPGHAPDELRSARAIVAGLMSRVREAVSLLRDNDHARLTPVLHSLATDGPGLKIHLSISGNIDETDSGRAHALMRCLQEIITNARRHSGAGNLWLVVKRNADEIVATARDDGRGADFHVLAADTAKSDSGHGLSGIRERLESYGGRLKVETTIGNGFSLEVILPLEAGT